MSPSTFADSIEPIVDRLVDPVIDKLRRATASALRPRTTWSSTLGTKAIVLGVALASSLVIVKILSRTAQRNSQQSVEARRDKTLKESFPASDPPASQYFDIPANRQ